MTSTSAFHLFLTSLIPHVSPDLTTRTRKKKFLNKSLQGFQILFTTSCLIYCKSSILGAVTLHDTISSELNMQSSFTSNFFNIYYIYYNSNFLINIFFPFPLNFPVSTHHRLELSRRLLNKKKKSFYVLFFFSTMFHEIAL